MPYFIVFILLLSTGFDVLAVNTPVGAVRFSFLLFLLAAIWMFFFKEFKVSKVGLIIFLLIIFMMLISTYFSFSPIRSLSYIVWFIICYLFYFSVTKNAIRQFSPESIIKVFRDLGRLQILGCIFLKVLGVDRPSLFFYEPSYMVIALLPYTYFTILQFKLNNTVFKLIDVMLVGILVLITMSANLLLSILVVILVGYLRPSFKSIFILICFSVLSYYFSIWYYTNNSDLLAFTFQKIHESPDIIASLLERAGNRWPRTMIGIDVAKEYFNSGIGLGAFADFSIYYNVYKDYAGGFVWNEPRGFPASNVFIELLAEGGIGVLVVFLIFILYTFFSSLKVQDNKRYISDWRKIIFIFFILLMFESSLLRPYFWAYLGVLASFTALPNCSNLKRLNK